MCTESQKKYIEKLSKWKDRPIDMAVVEKMSESEASELIDQLKALKSVKKEEKEDKRVGWSSAIPAGRTVVETKTPQVNVSLDAARNASLEVKTWNPIQAGMVKKAVCDFHLGAGHWLPSAEGFAEQCLELYDAFEHADDVIKRKYPEVSK